MTFIKIQSSLGGNCCREHKSPPLKTLKERINDTVNTKGSMDKQT